MLLHSPRRQPHKSYNELLQLSFVSPEPGIRDRQTTCSTTHDCLDEGEAEETTGAERRPKNTASHGTEVPAQEILA